ncbi:chaplin [Streptacidiphilus rugosus]|uniref:chaplin n=1 Tax=Streptacidiphilus rugosus TaxID=405783 RepID=UPI00055DCA5A|nr:chaplin [Streptacidiphilus rugosus]
MRKFKTAAAVSVAAIGLLLGGAGAAAADATANGSASNSPGFLSGNVIQIPIHIPVNLCGNSINVIGALNPAFGNHCSNS